MKNRGLVYTVTVLSVLTALVVYLVSRKQTQMTDSNQQDVKVTIAPEKQVVKPDDVIEEVIIGNDSDVVIGDESFGYRPNMTDISSTFVRYQF